MAKKNLDENIVNAAEMFFFAQAEDEPKEEPVQEKKSVKRESKPKSEAKPEKKGEAPKKGSLNIAKLRKESKSKKVLLYLQPSQYDRVRKLAEDNDISVNGLFTLIIDQFLDENS